MPGTPQNVRFEPFFRGLTLVCDDPGSTNWAETEAELYLDNELVASAKDASFAISFDGLDPGQEYTGRMRFIDQEEIPTPWADASEPMEPGKASTIDVPSNFFFTVADALSVTWTTDIWRIELEGTGDVDGGGATLAPLTVWNANDLAEVYSKKAATLDRGGFDIEFKSLVLSGFPSRFFMGLGRPPWPTPGISFAGVEYRSNVGQVMFRSGGTDIVLAQETPLAIDVTQWHEYKIEIRPGVNRLLIDGDLMAEHDQYYTWHGTTHFHMSNVSGVPSGRREMRVEYAVMRYVT